MTQDNDHVKANAHPDAEVHQGEHSSIPHPPPEDHHSKPSMKPIPETGWTGPIPSQEGGDREEDFLNKPPYNWKSEGDKFVPKYVRSALFTTKISNLVNAYNYSECWCGNLSFEFHGDPVDAKHCHCRQCQHLHGAPFQWAVIFPKV